MIKAIVTDIEGTTTSIGFVHDVLFPYSVAALPGFLESYWKEERLQKAVEEIGRLSGISPLTPETTAQLLRSWIAEDRKVTPLKAIQGMIWNAGYTSGALKSQLYADAFEYLQEWHKRGVKLAIFSSGSIEAQKLLFKYSEYGDLADLFSCHFDTTTGPKRDVRAYESIRAALVLPASDILFLSDIAEELDAAAGGGMVTCQVVRTEDGTKPCTGHYIARNFGEIEHHYFH